mmetsp:Transcript_22738/g.37642  ORF Transcript_22738/g.37642 Transcript_22738/m.37642 type:complete len:317 (-) Transcript_22738:24-974(-)
MSVRYLEAASSGDESSDSEEESAPLIRSLDDLPSDDSVSLEDDGDEEDSDDEDNDRKVASKDADDDDVPLSERLERDQERGMSRRVQNQRRDRKAAALVKAKKQLKQAQIQQQKGENKKRSKHAPTQASSKRSEFFKRGAPQLNSAGIGVEIGAHRYKARDPRMSSMSGRLNEDHFEHHYGFLEDLRKEEITALQRRSQARKVSGKKGQKLRQKLGLTAANATTVEQDQEQLLMLKQQQAQYQRNQVDRTAKRSVKRKLREEVETGQRGAYFVKRKDLKRMELEAKYDELSKRGGVDRMLEKRRKKNKSKDSSLMN